MKFISVKSSKNAFVQDFQALEQGIRRYLSRRFDSESNSWKYNDATHRIPVLPEYLSALRNDELIPICDDAKALSLKLTKK